MGARVKTEQQLSSQSSSVNVHLSKNIFIVIAVVLTMNSFSSEMSDEEVPGMSISLVSYGSDLDASVDDFPLHNLQTKTSSSADTCIENESATGEEAHFDSLRQRFQTLSCSGLSEKKRKELEEAMREAEASRLEYLQAIEVDHALRTVIASDKLPQPTREAAQNLMRRQDLLAFVGTDESPGVLGLTEKHLWSDCPQQLSETDKKIVRLAVESHLIETARELKQTESSQLRILNKVSGTASNNAGFKVESDHTTQMAKLRCELNDELDRYHQLLISLDSLLETIVQMRTNEVSEKCLKTIDGFEAKAELLKQQARLINAEIQSKIYNEDANLVPAVQHLEKHLDDLNSELEMELSDAKQLLGSYQRVRSKEYDNIVKEYSSVVQQIKSAKYIISQFSNSS